MGLGAVAHMSVATSTNEGPSWEMACFSAALSSWGSSTRTDSTPISAAMLAKFVPSVAFTGARSSSLEVQVATALRRPVDVAVIVIGANDVTHRIPVASAALDLSRAVSRLRQAGAQVVVGTCPDLGTVKPVMQPLRTIAAWWSRRLAAAQTVATVDAGGISVSLGDLLAQDFRSKPHLWSHDRFHPSADGYRRIVDAVLPSLLESAGVQIPVSVPISDSVQDVQLAAKVAAREPGVEVDPLPGAEGTGRLARLRRRLPLVGRGAPLGRTDSAELPAEAGMSR